MEFWSLLKEDVLLQLQTTDRGLTTDEAQARLKEHGANALKPVKKTRALLLLTAQFTSPIVLILVFAAFLSLFLHDNTDAIIILSIVLLSGMLGFWQERGADNAIAKLLAVVQVKAQVFRDGNPQEIPVEEIVPGDIILVRAGDVIPGDCLLLESKDLFLDEASLTGETFPVEKAVGIQPADTPLGQRTNALFMGTHVVSGSAKAVVVRTGGGTEYGKVSSRLRLRPLETEFERGTKRFGYLLMEMTLFMVISIFAVNVYLARPVMDSFLFSLALAVGLTPQLLPAIISINLAHGAKRMAKGKVIVKRLASIENFGSMNVLCSDKTGTLTEGVVRIHSSLDAEGKHNEKVLFYAYLNAFYETGFINPVDEAIRSHHPFDLSGYDKLDEVPYDFVRKRLSLLLAHEGRHMMVTKGALREVLAVCSAVETATGKVVDINSVHHDIERQFAELSSQGYRTLGVAYRDVGSDTVITRNHEAGMIFLGFLVLHDPLKPEIEKTIEDLQQLGVRLKIITGDNALVAAKTSQQIGITQPEILTGVEMRQMSDEALWLVANDVDIFAETEPNQKERILLALKKTGNVVGYLGDGINDAPALHAADVGISVDSGVDVAKEAADIVLMEKDLYVLLQGVKAGRTTFANTLKYVFMATSANFGNMFSMAIASIFLPFLPLLPKQILLANLLTDLPEMTIATDSVDQEMITKPRRWNITFIRSFMLTFGPLSSLFDFLTFAVLMLLLKSTADQFRTGWFVESLISAPLIVLVIRSRRPLFQSIPSKSLLSTTLLVIALALALPLLPFAGTFGFAALPLSFYLFLILIVVVYVAAAEATKVVFYRKTA